MTLANFRALNVNVFLWSSAKGSTPVCLRYRSHRESMYGIVGIVTYIYHKNQPYVHDTNWGHTRTDQEEGDAAGNAFARLYGHFCGNRFHEYPLDRTSIAVTTTKMTLHLE